MSDRQQQARDQDHPPVGQRRPRTAEPHAKRQHQADANDDGELQSKGTDVCEPECGRHRFFPIMRVMSRRSDFRQLIVFEQVQHQRPRRPVEDAIDEIPNHRADHLLLWLGRAIKVRAILERRLEVALLLQGPHVRHDSGVGDRSTGAELFVDVAHGDGAVMAPDNLHQLQLVGGEGGGLRSHAY